MFLLYLMVQTNDVVLCEVKGLYVRVCGYLCYDTVRVMLLLFSWNVGNV